MRQIKKAFEEQGLESARAYLTKAIDSKLSTWLKTMVDEATGQPKVTEATTIEEILKLLEDLYVEAKPLWVQQTNYFNPKKAGIFWPSKSRAGVESAPAYFSDLCINKI